MRKRCIRIQIEASAVLDVLRFRLDSLGVKIVTSFEVKVKKKRF